MDEFLRRLYGMGHKIARVGEIREIPVTGQKKDLPEHAFFVDIDVRPAASEDETDPNVRIWTALAAFNHRHGGTPPSTQREAEERMRRRGLEGQANAPKGVKDFSQIAFSVRARSVNEFEKFRQGLIESIKRRDAESKQGGPQ